MLLDVIVAEREPDLDLPGRDALERCAQEPKEALPGEAVPDALLEVRIGGLNGGHSPHVTGPGPARPSQREHRQGRLEANGTCRRGAA